MKYIVWQKGEFGDDWKRHDVEGDAALAMTILERERAGGNIEVTVPIAYTIKVSVSKPPDSVMPTEPKEPKQPAKATKEEVKGETGKS